MIYNISEFAFERDKRKAYVETRDYFVKKNRQEKTWHLVTAVMNSLKQKMFSSIEAGRITEFLSRKFEIRRPAIDLAQAICFSTIPGATNRVNIKTALVRKSGENIEISDQLFLRIQAAVQDDLLSYSEARSMVREIIGHYPKAQKYLQR